MEFFKKYLIETILSVFLMLVILGACCHFIISDFTSRKEITREDIVARAQGEDYTRIFDEAGNEDMPEGYKPKYPGKEYFENENALKVSKRDPGSTVFMVPYKAARCKVCKKVIPITGFKKYECPICKENPGIGCKQCFLLKSSHDKHKGD